MGRGGAEMLQQLRRKAKSDDERMARKLQSEEDAKLAQQLQQMEQQAIASITPRAAGLSHPTSSFNRQQNVNRNMQQALEENPESFAQVEMLRVRCEINGVRCNAIVDTGAQMTVMSAEFAKRCGLDGLIDQRWQGVAQGVGTARFLGRVHLAEMLMDDKIAVGCSFTILPSPGLDILIGLDMLRKHSCVIDLDRDVMLVGGLQGMIVSFARGAT